MTEILGNKVYSFGEWVTLPDGRKGQVVDFYGNGWYMIDFNGMWERHKL